MADPNRLLRRARERRGWTQARLADLIGTNAFTISRWERGAAVPSLHLQHHLLRVFTLSPEELGLQLEGDEVESAPPRGAVPVVCLAPLAPPLVGRDTDLDALRTLLHAENGTVAITGLPGVGKTSLALTLAHDAAVQTRYPDGVLWGGLGPAPDLMHVLRGWANELGVPTAAIEEEVSLSHVAQALTRQIGHRRLLIVLDDAWTSEAVRACHVGGPHCMYLVTTRSLQLAHHLAPAHTYCLPELSEAAAMTLLAALAPVVFAAPSAANEMLIRNLGGLPLTLTLIGHYLQAESYSQQPRRIRQALEAVTQAASRSQLHLPAAHLRYVTTSGVPISLDAVIGLSITHLPAAAQTLLPMAAWFPAKPNTFSEAALLASSGLPLETFVAALDPLVDAGLVSSLGTDRYTLHQTIRDIVQLSSPSVPANEAFVHYFVDLVTQPQFETDALAREWHNLLAALEYAADAGYWRALGTGASALAAHLRQRGRLADAQRWLQAAVDHCPPTDDPRYLLTLQRELGATALARADYATASVTTHQTLQLALDLGDGPAHLQAISQLGALALTRGDGVQADAYLTEALVLAHQLDLPVQAMPIHLSLGSRALRQGAQAAAREHYTAALNLAQRHGQVRVQGQALEALGIVCGQEGAVARAIPYLQEALAIFQTLAFREAQASCLTNLGVAAMACQQMEAATTYLTQALAIARETGQRQRMVGVLGNLIAVALHLDQHDRATRYLTEGLVLAHEVGHEELLCGMLRRAAEVAVRQARFDDAHRYIAEGLRRATSASFPRVLAELHRIAGEAYLAQGDFADAQQAFTASCVFGEAHRFGDIHALAQFGQARVMLAQGDRDAAWREAMVSLHACEQIQLYEAQEIRQWLVQRWPESGERAYNTET